MMVPSEAKICPHCRKQLKTSLATKLILGFIVIGIFGASMGFFIEPSPEVKESMKADDIKMTLYLKAERFIKTLIKYPESAVFLTHSESSVNKQEGYKKGKKNLKGTFWVVSSYVDSQNSFGTRGRTTFQVVFKDNNGQYELIDHCLDCITFH